LRAGGEDVAGGVGKGVGCGVFVTADVDGDLLTVICCSGRSARTIFLMLSPVVSCRGRATARAVMTTVR
jgi:hypothetical protein